MPLVLKTLRCPAGVAPDRRRVAGDTFGIGRGTDNDWTLPDPDRVLSKRHCVVAASGEGWTITDNSSNGTLLNGHDIDPSVPHPLRDGDRLTLGTYEIEARFDDDPPDVGGTPLRQGVRPAPFTEDRLTGDPFELLDGDAVQVARPSIGLSADFDPLIAGNKAAENLYSVPDHTPVLQQNFRPPRPSFELLPEDWDLNAKPTPTPPASAPASTPAPTPAPAPIAAEPAPLAPAPAPRPDSTNRGSATGFAAFAEGAGVAGLQPDDPDATLRALGATFRALVSGLRRSIIARATIKGAFRIGQTMIQADGNNPLKFAVNDEDALAALLGISRKGVMSAEQAVSGALRDMRLHELAVTTAMHQAVRDLLSEIAPARVMGDLRDAGDSGLDRLLARRQKAAWAAYQALHERMVGTLEDEFDSVFGRSFVRAYETALADIAARDAGDNA
jgi:type VI secretion system FHA domain protein